MKDDLHESGQDAHTDTQTLSWQIKEATEADVEPTLVQLSDHMNELQRAALRDKLERYARKPDRVLILAKQDHLVLGFVCAIQESEVPSGLPAEAIDRLKPLAHGTQLYVHPQFREQGVGSGLYLEVEQWARDQGKAGFWMVTHRKAYWYTRDFGFEEVGRIIEKGAEKIVMVKEFL